MNNNIRLTRRHWLQGASALGTWIVLDSLLPTYARAQSSMNMDGMDMGGMDMDGMNQGNLRPGSVPEPSAAAPTGQPDVYDLSIAEVRVMVNGRVGVAQAVNGLLPGPILRLREGNEAIIRVHNQLPEVTSIHWHGLIVPAEMDGVPGVSYAGIQPGETFEYRFPVRQSGTYWYHSHSGGQELRGVYGPIIIDPIEPEPFPYDRDYVVVLSDWSFMKPETIMKKMKQQSGYFNYQKRTVSEFLSDTRKNGWKNTVDNYKMWSKMRMDPTDFADVTGVAYTYLLNGMTSEANWVGLFKPGERVRLRFINAATMTIHDVRIPGLKLRVVEVDGQYVNPVEVDEFRIAPAETYDVIVEPEEDKAYAVFAETIDRGGFASGTLAPRPEMRAPLPQRRSRPLRTMADMGMDMSGMSMGGMDMGGMDMPGMDMPGMDMGGMSGMNSAGTPSKGLPSKPDKGREAMPGMEDMGSMSGMDMSGMSSMNGLNVSAIPGEKPVPHGPDHHGPGNQATPMVTRSRLSEPGTGLENNGRRVLVYTDLRALEPYADQRAPEREVELHITGNMEQQIWGFDGKKYSEAPAPIQFKYGERVRLTLVNDTMMEHPIHLHGMWFHLENGHGDLLPRKHTILVKPAERVSLLITADAPGRWAMHCHLLFHMEMGMFRVVEVVGAPLGARSGDLQQSKDGAKSPRPAPKPLGQGPSMPGMSGDEHKAMSGMDMGGSQ